MQIHPLLARRDAPFPESNPEGKKGVPPPTVNEAGAEEASGRADRPGRPWGATSEDGRAGGLEGSSEAGVSWQVGKLTG
jgi:hypothetical protein